MCLSNEKLLGLVEKNADLHHAKRDACFLRQAALGLSSPGAPLPQAAAKGTLSSIHEPWSPTGEPFHRFPYRACGEPVQPEGAV